MRAPHWGVISRRLYSDAPSLDGAHSFLPVWPAKGAMALTVVAGSLAGSAFSPLTAWLVGVAFVLFLRCAVIISRMGSLQGSVGGGTGAGQLGEMHGVACRWMTAR